MECREIRFTLESQKGFGIHFWKNTPSSINIKSNILVFFWLYKDKVVFLQDVKWNIHNLIQAFRLTLPILISVVRDYFMKDHLIRSYNSDPLSHQFIVFDGWFLDVVFTTKKRTLNMIVTGVFLFWKLYSVWLNNF